MNHSKIFLFFALKRSGFYSLFLASVLFLAACVDADAPARPTQPPAPTVAVVGSSTAAPTPKKAPAAAPSPTPKPAPVEPTEAPTQPDVLADAGQLARQHLEALSAEIGPRLSGSKAERKAAKYIQQAFEDAGYTVAVRPFSYEDVDTEEDMSSANLIAVKPGDSPRQIIVGAHYDSGDEAEGADDNASGVAVLLETAALIQDQPTPYTIIFIAFGAEENDINGSHYYVSRMSKDDVANTVAMINLDSLAAGNFAYVYGSTAPGSLMNWFVQTAKLDGFELQGISEEELDEEDGTPCDCADYDAFQESGISFAYFEATDWTLGDQDGMTQVNPQFGDEGEIRHTKYDTIEYIDETFPGRIDRYMSLFVTLLYQALTQFR